MDVPSYRIVGVTYKGTWSGPWGGGVQNSAIPPYLIEQHAGKQWTQYQVRESIAGVEELIKGGEHLGIDASNLILLLQGKVYEDWACNSIGLWKDFARCNARDQTVSPQSGSRVYNRT